MKESDFPIRCVLRELVFNPLHLFLVHVGAIQRIERDVALLETVILLAIHIEVFVIHLNRQIVVSERSVKLYVTIEQRFVHRARDYQQRSNGDRNGHQRR